MDRLYIFMAAFLIAYMLRKIINEVYGGELIMSLGRGGIRERRTQRIIWILFLIVYVFIFVSELRGSDDYLHYIMNGGWSSIFGILITLLEIVRGYGPTEIREKGMYFNNSFYKYKNLTGYVWSEEDVMRVYYKNIFRQDDFFDVEINDKYTALKADETLQKYFGKKDEAIL